MKECQDMVGKACTFNITSSCGKKQQRSGLIEDAYLSGEVGIRTKTGVYFTVEICEGKVRVK